MALLIVVLALLCAQCLLTTGQISNNRTQVSVKVQPEAESCRGPQPSVKIATRVRNTSTVRTGEQPFGGWNLALFSAGENCSGQLIHNVQNGDTYQFRVELSPADSCHCITVHADLIDNNNWCNQPNGTELCANSTTTATFLSRPVEVFSAPTPDVPVTNFLNCSVPFALDNVLDTAVAYERRFNSCSLCRFPMATLNSEEMQVTVSFSLIMTYEFNSGVSIRSTVPQCQCPECQSQILGLGYVNEGILLRANPQLNREDNLHFYYSQNDTSRDASFVTVSGDQVIIGNHTVSSTQNRNVGLLNFTLNNTHIVNRNVSLSWEQRTTNDTQHCSVWALDNVRVNLHYQECTRTLLDDDFEDANTTELMIDPNPNMSTGAFNCLESTSSCRCLESNRCLYFDQRTNCRKATTPYLNTNIVTAVKPPLAPASQPGDSCQSTCNYTNVTVRFHLSMFRFQYPTPCNDDSPNGITLGALAAQGPATPMAYFTPLANTNWKNFSTNLSSLLINGSVPVYSTQPDQLIEISKCVDTAGNDTLLLGWRQEHYEREHDYWYLNISSVQIDGVNITGINVDGSKKYNVSQSGAQSNETDCFVDYMFRVTGNDTRYVQLSFNLTEVQTAFPTTTDIPSPTTTMDIVGSPSVPSSMTPFTESNTVMTTTSPTATITPSSSIGNIQDLIKTDPLGGLMKLLELGQSKKTNVSNAQRLELLRRAFTVQSNANITDMFVETSLRVVQDGIDEANDAETGRGLLFLLDEVALSLRRNVTINITNIVMRVQEVGVSGDSVLGIASEDSYIRLPPEVFSSKTGPSFVASYYFRNISKLLPGDQPVSPVLSATLFCDGCRINDLAQSVSIFFPFYTSEAEGQCQTTDNQSSLVNGSLWSNSGCQTIKFDNGSILCSCNHLTHFAILLSPGANSIPEEQTKILATLGQVFVTFSLVFLLATILVFAMNRALWSMRNYIHVMLCANMFVAQLLFVVGVERTENKAVCSAIAVLLQYLFLVVFMWMLMEGVVLYVALVRVFITHPGRYIVGYTIASYGVPLIYMAIVVPIGFLVNTDDIGHHYGYYNNETLTACWLRYDTHFIWAFISPVIVIIMANIGFLIMALVIMYRHFKKQQKKSEIAKAWHWVKVILALAIVMGIAWIGNLLFFDINLLFVAYIMTIFIAGQGIFIFILFVPLSEQVRHAYLKWWRNRVSRSSFLTKHFTMRPTSQNATTTTSVSVQNNTTANAEENIYVMRSFETGAQEGSPQELPTDVEVNEKVIHLKIEETGNNDDDDDDSNDETT